MREEFVKKVLQFGDKRAYHGGSFMEKYKDVAIIDYGMGNLRSVLRAWQAVGAQARIINAPGQILPDDILVFPGQGCIVEAMKLLNEITAENDCVILEVLQKNGAVIGYGTPLFRIRRA